MARIRIRPILAMGLLFPMAASAAGKQDMSVKAEIFKLGGIALEQYIPDGNPQEKRLLLLPSAGHGSWMWRYFLPYFAGRGYSSWAVNLRGHYLSDPVENWESVGVSAYLEDIDRAVEQVGGDVVIAGHSMSGLLILKYAGAYPLAGLIVSQSGLPKSMLLKRGIELTGSRPGKDKLRIQAGAVMPLEDREVIRAFLFDRDNVTEENVDLVLQMMGKESARGGGERMQMELVPDRCQDKEDVFFGVEMKDRTDGAVPELSVTIYTESFVEKNKVWTSQRDMIAKIEKEIKKDKQEMLYSLGIIDIPTLILIAKVPRPDAEGRQHFELSVENRGKTALQMRTDTNKKFVGRDGKSYDILREESKNGDSIRATSSGEGCQLTNKNTLFLVNPGSKCSLSAPIRLPGVSQQPPDGMITLDLFTFDMRRVSSYEDKTSPPVRLPR